MQKEKKRKGRKILRNCRSEQRIKKKKRDVKFHDHHRYWSDITGNNNL